MIKFQITNALVYEISQEIVIQSKNGGQPFKKRELILDDSWVGKDGKTNVSLVSIEFSGEKMAQLNYIQPGMRVNVEALISGRESNGRVFNTVKGMSVTSAQPQFQQGGYQQNPAYPQSVPCGYPQQQYPQQNPFGGQPGGNNYPR